MKKIISTILALICLLLCSCKASDIFSFATDKNGNSGDAPSVSVVDTPDYNSFKELKNAIKNDKSFLASFSGNLNDTEANNLKAFAEKLRESSTVVPCIEGKAIELRNEEGYSNISVYHSELYGLPWIFYHPKVSSGENFYIKITFLPDSMTDEQKSASASEIIRTLSPKSPNVDNLGDYHKSIYSKNLKLKDREVTALVTEYKDDSRNSTVFVYGDLLVEVKGSAQIWNDQWFASLSFEEFDK